MTVREFLERLEIPVPDGLIGEYEIFINGLPSFDKADVDHMARVVYMEG